MTPPALRATSPASLLRRGHICRRAGIALRTRVWTAPQSETVKLRTVSRAKYLHGISAVSASDLPVTGLHSKTSFPSIPAFSAISATRFDCRQRRVADTAGSPGTPARRPAHPPRAGDRRLRTIDGADVAVILLPGDGGNHTADLSISQAIV